MEQQPPKKDIKFVIAEPQLLPDGDKKAKLEEDKYFKQTHREEQLKTNLHKVFVCIIWVAFSAFVVVFLIRVVHFILPGHWAWLTDLQIQGIDKLIFSGAIGGFIGRYLNKVNS